MKLGDNSTKMTAKQASQALYRKNNLRTSQPGNGGKFKNGQLHVKFTGSYIIYTENPPQHCWYPPQCLAPKSTAQLLSRMIMGELKPT